MRNLVYLISGLILASCAAPQRIAKLDTDLFRPYCREVRTIDLYEQDRKNREIEKRILFYTNEARKKEKLRPLQLDSRLEKLAREHSEFMADHAYFSHGEGRYRVGSRGTRKPPEGVAENIAEGNAGHVRMYNTKGKFLWEGYVDDDAESIAAYFVLGWILSPGHRRNVLNRNARYIGIGVEFNGTYYLATQNFSR